MRMVVGGCVVLLVSSCGEMECHEVLLQSSCIDIYGFELAITGWLCFQESISLFRLMSDVLRDND